MINFNDMFIFSKVVEHKGITGAAKALGISHSSISRSVAALETRLKVRLIQRSTRHFVVTELGTEFNRHCINMIAEANAAEEKIVLAQEKPSGLVRISCPAMLAQFVIGPLIPLFLKNNPDVRISIDTTERDMRLEESFDLSIRIRLLPCEDSGLMARPLGIFQPALVASKEFLERFGRPKSLEELLRMPTISYSSAQGPHVWTLITPENNEIQARHQPILVVEDFVVTRQAALQGIGVALLPLSLCLEDIRDGALEIVLPEFNAPVSELQAVFPSRHGMLPAVRLLIDFLSAHCVSDLQRDEIAQHSSHGPHGSVRFWTSRHSIEEMVEDLHRDQKALPILSSRSVDPAVVK
ncbi:LysR family transcriptional regulator [Paraburkholderia sp. BCC1884]|uniref:LysR family transcriptional regulator n=1 Tax=Paraburkholderia sp. BCC1884 TaxID=2562668 RepID=UPI0016425762|nr:LysR family transcriptional regulator [Paraburkholderia sp. BCC1884]